MGIFNISSEVIKEKNNENNSTTTGKGYLGFGVSFGAVDVFSFDIQIGLKATYTKNQKSNVYVELFKNRKGKV